MCDDPRPNEFEVSARGCTFLHSRSERARCLCPTIRHHVGGRGGVNADGAAARAAVDSVPSSVVTGERRSRFSVLADAVHTALWPVPTAAIVVALALGVGLPNLDVLLDDNLSPAVRDFLFGGGAGAARSVLSAISGSLITVTSLTFSLTVVTLQLASSQFSPRLLRTFSRDPYVHWTLALFLGTFTYSLVVLRTVRDGNTSDPGFVPQISVTFAVLLTVASVFGLVLFLAHLARQIRVETMLHDVHEDAVETVRRVLEKPPDDLSTLPVAPTPPPLTRPVVAAKSGFLIRVDEQDLFDAACAAGAVVVIEGSPGGSVVSGTPMGRTWPLDGAPLPPQDQQRLDDQVAAAIHTGPERTAAQDIAYGLRQLTDVAVKALSPGINDPTTAVYALGHISALLCETLDYQLGPKLLDDEQGRVRVVLERPELANLLDSAIAETRRYGKDAPDVLARISRLLREVGWRTKDDQQQQAVRDQLRRLRTTINEQNFGSAETTELHRLNSHVEDALTGRW